MNCVALIGGARLFSKEKAIKHSKSRSIHPIVTKLDIYVGLLRILLSLKINYVALIGSAGLSSNEKSGKYSIGRNFDPIITKLGTHVGLIKLQI